MNPSEALDKIYSKVELLAKKLEKANALTKELKEENRIVNNQLNDYTELIGDLEMEVVDLKKKMEKKK